MDALTSGLEKLANLLNGGIISQAQFEEKKSALVNQYVGISDAVTTANASLATTRPPPRVHPRVRHAMRVTPPHPSQLSQLVPLGKGKGRGAYSGLGPVPVGRGFERPTPYQRSPLQRQLLAQWGTSVKVQPIPESIDEQQLAEAFSEYGEVVSAAVHRGSPPFGHVNFTTREAANAVASLDKFDWGGQTVFVTLSRRRWEATQEAGPSNGIGIFNLPLTTTQESLQELLSVYPGLQAVKLVYNKVSSAGRGGQFKGYAFAYFDSVENATLAKAQLIGIQVEDCIIDVKFSNKPSLDPTQ